MSTNKDTQAKLPETFDTHDHRDSQHHQRNAVASALLLRAGALLDRSIRCSGGLTDSSKREYIGIVNEIRDNHGDHLCRGVLLIYSDEIQMAEEDSHVDRIVTED